MSHCCAIDKRNIQYELGVLLAQLWRIWPTGIKSAHIAVYPVGNVIFCVAALIAEQCKLDIKWVKEAAVAVVGLKAFRGMDVFLQLTDLVFSKLNLK